MERISVVISFSYEAEVQDATVRDETEDGAYNAQHVSGNRRESD